MRSLTPSTLQPLFFPSRALRRIWLVSSFPTIFPSASYGRRSQERTPYGNTSHIRPPQAAKVRILFVLQEGLPPLTPIIGYNVSRRIPSLPDSAIHHSFTRSDLESDLEQEKLIVSAVRNMKCLREFAWHREAPPSLRGRHGLWSTLKELGTVRRLDVLDCAERGDGILQSPSVRGPRLCVLANPG